MINIEQVHVVDNDDAAERILLNAGMLEQSKPIPPFNTCNMVFHDDGYYILCQRSESFQRPEDNGLVLIMVPESAGTGEEIAEFLMCFAEGTRVPGTPSIMVATV